MTWSSGFTEVLVDKLVGDPASAGASVPDENGEVIAVLALP
jgi:hypothetical protein